MMKLWYYYGHVRGVIEKVEANFEWKLAEDEIANPIVEGEEDYYEWCDRQLQWDASWESS